MKDELIKIGNQVLPTDRINLVRQYDGNVLPVHKTCSECRFSTSILSINITTKWREGALQCKVISYNDTDVVELDSENGTNFYINPDFYCVLFEARE